MKMLLLFASFFWTTILLSQTKYLIPYREGNLWGYADTNLKIVVKPKYDEANVFWNGYASVREQQYYGLLKANGAKLLKPIYEDVTERHGDHLIIVMDGRKGMISLKTGRIILPLNNSSIEELDHYNLIVADSKHKKGLWNIPTNRWVLPQKYLNIDRISRNAFIIENAAKAKGIIDIATQKWLLNPEYEEISFDPYSGMDNYWMARKKNKIIGFNVTTQGQIKIAKNYKKKEIVSVILDTISKGEIIEEIIENIVGDTQTMAIDESNLDSTSDRIKKVVPNIFEQVIETDSSDSHNIYIVKLKGKYGLANRDNKLLLKCNYDTIVMSKGDLPGYTLKINDQQGAFIYSKYLSLYNVLIEAKYDYMLGIYFLQPADYNSLLKRSFEYREGIFIVYVSRNGKRGYVDLKGREFFKD